MYQLPDLVFITMDKNTGLQKEEEKQKELELQRELAAKADWHYQRSLMKFRVLLPMKKLVQMAQERMEKATRHHNQQILR